MKKSILIILIVVLVGGSLYEFWSRAQNPTELEVHFIDIGQGDSILVRTPGGKNILIDSGSQKQSTKLLDYLAIQGVSRLDLVIATHPDEDHIGAMADVIQHIEVKRFFMPNKTHNTQSFLHMISLLRTKSIPVQKALAGTTLLPDEDVRLLVLHPGDRIYSDNNNYSVVIRLAYGHHSFLFTGDIDSKIEAELLVEYGELIDCDILKLAHHGSSGSSDIEFLRTASPLAAVASVGADNDYGHPHERVLNNLEQLGIPLYRTDEQGSIVFYSDKENLRVNVASPASRW